MRLKDHSNTEFGLGDKVRTKDGPLHVCGFARATTPFSKEAALKIATAACDSCEHKHAPRVYSLDEIQGGALPGVTSITPGTAKAAIQDSEGYTIVWGN